MSEPLVSVTVCVRDGAQWIDDCMAALAAQTYRPLEIIAVDDAGPADIGRAPFRSGRGAGQGDGEADRDRGGPEDDGEIAHYRVSVISGRAGERASGVGRTTRAVSRTPTIHVAAANQTMRLRRLDAALRWRPSMASWIQLR